MQRLEHHDQDLGRQSAIPDNDVVHRAVEDQSRLLLLAPLAMLPSPDSLQ
jgi:hypothetical protein